MSDGCPVCGSFDDRVVAKLPTCDILECRQCEFTRCNPLPTTHSASSGNSSVMTAEDYTAGLVHLSPYRMNLYRHLARGRHAEYERRLGRSTFSMLEIGCGSAGMSEEFVRLGVDYHGVDLDPRPIAAAHSRGAPNVRQGDFLADERSSCFEVIAASQVLEHITEPRRFIEKVADRLVTGGVLHIDVPNPGSLAGRLNRWSRISSTRWGGIDWPHHSFSFSPTSLRRLLNDAFEVEIRTAACDDRIWGQAYERHLPTQCYYRLTKWLRSPSILVAIGVKR